jgi:two-component system phosphate regulon sensor histidine kinase PhoR
VTDQRKEEARRAEFYAIVAHDLRSPLTAIALRTDLILRGKRGLLPAGLIEDIRRIQANTRGLVALISDFLDLARIEGTEGSFEPKEVDLVAIARKVLNDLEPLTEAKGLRVGFSACAGNVCVLGEGGRLTQVAANLVGNAIKFTPEGGRVSVEIRQNGEHVELSVEDTGIGIPADQVDRVFDRFARADAVRDKTTGTGLGLTIVREIVTSHGGEVGLDSTLGKGSRFWVRLPACPHLVRAAAHTPQAASAARS